MKTEDFQNPTRMLIINQSGGSIGKNPKRLVRSVYKFAKSITEISSKVRERSTYNEVINDPVYGINKEKLWMTSSGTWTNIRHRSIKFYHLIKSLLDANEFSRSSVSQIVLLGNIKYN